MANYPKIIFVSPFYLEHCQDAITTATSAYYVFHEAKLYMVEIRQWSKIGCVGILLFC